MEDGGAVIGMLADDVRKLHAGRRIQLEKGDLLIGSTTGITDAMNPHEEEWSDDATLEELKKVYGQTAHEILPHIVAEVGKFADGAKQHDDMTYDCRKRNLKRRSLFSLYR